MTTEKEIKSSKNGAYDAFAMVDSAVSKPVYGSDAAMKWQEFQKNAGSAVVSRNVAPQIPMKRADKLGTGFSNLKEEREHEERLRSSQGQVEVGSGYTFFKKKGNEDTADSKQEIDKKRNVFEQHSDPMQCGKLAIDFRERADDITYFIASESFTGWNRDYVFSTRHRGTGYYWDGMDTVKERHGLPTYGKRKDEGNNEKGNDDSIKAKKRQKKKKVKSSTLVKDAVDPFQQVADAIARRHAKYAEKMGISPLDMHSNNNNDLKALVAAGWSVANDSASGRRYYFNNDTRKTVWENPLTNSIKKSEESSTSDIISKLAAAGWSCANDATSGTTYYYHNQTRETRWENPLLDKK